jgi:hypothetical protein
MVRGEGFEPFRSESQSGFPNLEPLRDRSLSPAPLTWLGDPRINAVMMICADLMITELRERPAVNLKEI